MMPMENAWRAQDRMHALRRVHYVSANYALLQGLRLVPFGLLCVLVTVFPLLHARGRVGAMLLLLLWPVSWILVWTLWWSIGRHYRRRFGRTRPRRWTGWRVNVMLVVVLLGLFVSLAIDIILNVFLLVPVSTFGLLLGATGFCFYWPRREFAMHWVVLSLIVAFVSVLPPLVGYDPGGYPTTISIQLAVLALGLSVIVGGVLDHRLLTSTLGPLPEKDRGEAV